MSKHCCRIILTDVLVNQTQVPDSPAQSVSAKVCDEFPKMSVETSPFMCFLVFNVAKKKAYTWTEFNGVPNFKTIIFPYISSIFPFWNNVTCFLIPEMMSGFYLFRFLPRYRGRLHIQHHVSCRLYSHEWCGYTSSGGDARGENMHRQEWQLLCQIQRGACDK